ncbi:MAG TPA: hypothetical protein VHY37_07725 [Tepidisphaeraceae bacterium]|jgi:Ca2+/Na+ antiporter|nr:hypothetical protein [Tepidisphaeraceae bacterium]
MSFDSNRLWTAVMLLLAAVGLYGGCRAILDVLMPRPGGARAIGAAGRRAVGQAVPIAAAALVAMGLREPTLAMVILFSTSVALLTLVLGLATLAAHDPRHHPQATPAMPPAAQASAITGRNRRTWMLLLPAALVVFVAGLRSQFGWFTGSAILLMGVAIAAAWREAVRLGRHELEAHPAPTANSAVSPAWIALRAVQVILGLAVCAAGAWMMLKGATAAAAQSPGIRPGTIAAVVVCPLLVLPVLGSAATAAQHGAEIVTPLVGTVLINICLLLPACVAVSYAMTRSPVPFPPGIWRLENMLLVVLGLFLLLSALRWRSLRRAEGMLLVVGYFVYLMLLMAH